MFHNAELEDRSFNPGKSDRSMLETGGNKNNAAFSNNMFFIAQPEFKLSTQIILIQRITAKNTKDFIEIIMDVGFNLSRIFAGSGAAEVFSRHKPIGVDRKGAFNDIIIQGYYISESTRIVFWLISRENLVYFGSGNDIFAIFGIIQFIPPADRF
jgi:hypothetical protein